MQRLLVWMIVWHVACGVADNGYSIPSSRSSERIFLRVSKTSWCLERAVQGQSFNEGVVTLWGHPSEFMDSHRIGAQSLFSGVFSTWAGRPAEGDVAKQSSQVTIPRRGGPWVGVAVELQPKKRYQTDRFHPVPGQRFGPRPITTEVLHCSTPNILACIPWGEAVEAGLVRCENSARERLTAEECRRHVPYVQWQLKTRR